MNPSPIILEMTRNRDIFRHLLSNTPEETYLWRPQAQQWNLLEILCHLCDEEVDDFQARTRQALENPEEPFVAIDPEAWVSSRNYAEQNYEAKLKEFLIARDSSLQWLRRQMNAPWEQAFLHPELGPLSAGQLLANWLAHDYIHLRQIMKIKRAHLAAISGEDLSYAGNW